MPKQAKKTEKQTTIASDKYRKGRPKQAGERIVPFPQRERIKEKYIAGQNIQEIAEQEKRNWHTVAKIVKSEDVKNYVANLRAKWMGQMDEILLNAIIGAKDRWNPELAYKMAKDAGIIPGGKHDQLTEPLTLDNNVSSSEDRIREMARIMVEGALRRQQSFNLPLPELDGDHVQEKQEESDDED